MIASHSAAPHSQRRARGVSQPVVTRKELAASARAAEPITLPRPNAGLVKRDPHVRENRAVTPAHEELDGIFLARPPEADEIAAGRRLAVKDLFDTAGLTTTYGSILFADHVPTESAEAVRLAEAAGWIDIGKTNLH